MLREHPDQGISRGRRGHAPIPDYLCRADVLSVSYRVGFVIGFHGCASQGGAGKQAALCSRISKDIGAHVIGSDRLCASCACNRSSVSA